MSNFNPELKTDEDFLTERYCRELMSDDLFWCTTNMTEEEIRMSIIADLLAFTFWNIDNKTKLNITFEELVRFVNPKDVERIREQLQHPEIVNRFRVDPVKLTYHIIESKENLQACMDYSGVWFDGYEPPADAEVLTMSEPMREKIQNAITEHGGIEQLAKSMAMDYQSNSPHNTTMN